MTSELAKKIGLHASARAIEASSAQSPSRGVGKRLRIWEIDASMHCSVLGTCLPLKDLYAIARRAGYRLDPRASAYQIHSWFVDMMVAPNELAKRVDKAIEKRHLTVAQKVRCARTTAELDQRWRDVHAEGQIAGAYWGAMSHPICNTDLRWRLFGEIHMLSHLLGASRRSDLCRLHDLELATAARDHKHAVLKEDYRSLLKANKALEAKVDSQRRDGARTERLLTDAQERIAALESGMMVREYEARTIVLEQRLGEVEAHCSSAETSASELRARLADALARAERADEQVDVLMEENEAIEVRLARTFAASLPHTTRGVGDLGGMRVMYVGGRASLVPHYRELIERHHGEFLHHDGGLEESLDGVTRALSTVDVVVCPVDCISHAACLLAKKACRNLAKRFVPLRSAGLSSLAWAISTIEASPPLQDESKDP